MSARDPRVTLRQLRDAARRLQTLCANRTLDSLLADWQATAALERCIEIVGEAVKRLSAGKAILREDGRARKRVRRARPLRSQHEFGCWSRKAQDEAHRVARADLHPGLKPNWRKGHPAEDGRGWTLPKHHQ